MTSAPPQAAAAPTVLIVDDDAAVLGSLQFSLELDGYRVRAYADGAALLADAALPSSGCLVIDFHIPGDDGLAVIDRLRSRRVMMPALLITTAPPDALVRRAAVAGVPIIEKPLFGPALANAIRAALARC